MPAFGSSPAPFSGNKSFFGATASTSAPHTAPVFGASTATTTGGFGTSAKSAPTFGQSAASGAAAPLFPTPATAHAWTSFPTRGAKPSGFAAPPATAPPTFAFTAPLAAAPPAAAPHAFTFASTPAATPSAFSFPAPPAAPSAFATPAPTFASATPPAFAPTPPTALAALAAPPALVIDGVVATACPNAQELAERREQAAMFTADVRRDVYAFLLNPDAPGAPRAAGAERFGAALLGKCSGRSAGAPVDTLALVDRSSLGGVLPTGWTLLDDTTLLSALDHLGETEPLALAAMGALEKLLARKAAAWGDAQVGHFSVEFLVCFGAELTPRLDVHHRLRSTRLSDAELATLAAAPYNKYVDADVLRRYQRAPAPTTALAAPQARADALSTPPPALPDALSEPASPRMPALPAPPPPTPPAAMTAHAQLFSKA